MSALPLPPAPVPAPASAPAPAAGAGHRILLQPDSRYFRAALGETLLEAALRAGLDWPRSCRNGTCRSCRTRVLAGAFRHRIAWPGLNADEIAEGWVLPCVAEPEGELTVMTPQEALR